MTIYPGDPYPLGSFWDGRGVNFAVYSHNAEGVELCLFDKEQGEKETECIRLTQRTHDIWHVYLYEYAALAHPEVIRHLKKVGITAVELMPVHQSISDRWMMPSCHQRYCF